ncbi:esterase/lipase family protein [Nocardiopsis ansamitocini]|nr:alpha/beta fold hydrolase [Nocardiopsis ansamitocini]
MRSFLAAACALAAALALSVVPAAAAHANAHDPVIFVHGFGGKGNQWSSMRQNFIDNGYRADQLHVFSYDSLRSNKTIASQLSDRVQQVRTSTGAAKVDIVTHSMGGLSSRWYLKFGDGQQYVDDWVSIGGPNNGTNIANLCTSLITPCKEMRQGSEFLSELNADDPTPGDVSYATFRSPCDVVINPVDSTLLDGATNIRTSCLEHVAMMSNSAVINQVRDFVA